MSIGSAAMSLRVCRSPDAGADAGTSIRASQKLLGFVHAWLLDRYRADADR